MGLGTPRACGPHVLLFSPGELYVYQELVWFIPKLVNCIPYYILLLFSEIAGKLTVKRKRIIVSTKPKLSGLKRVNKESYTFN